MNSSKKARRITIAIGLALAIVFFATTYRSIEGIVTEQSRAQQQAVSPVYKLVQEELLRPLNVAETFASTVDFSAPLESKSFDEAALLRQLEALEQELGLKFFVASELTRKQYFSDGSELDLIEGEVAWYFEAKATGQDVMADLGKIGDVHLYFDVAVYGDDGAFLGYVGVGKQVQQFLDTFEMFKQQYGYDFVFVNQHDEILLTSLPELVVTGAYVPNLNSLDWFEHGDAAGESHDNEVIRVDNEELLISEFGIEALGWRLLLLTPMQDRQAQTTQSFLISTALALLGVLLVVATGMLLTRLYRQNTDQKSETDALTGLHNRLSVHRYYERIRDSDEKLCAIIIDLDRFKSINDTYGHDAGDRVLVAASEIFRGVLRDNDMVARWGGEEFVMLLPNASTETGLAIAERARRRLENEVIQLRETTVSVTASFGVAAARARDESLADLVARADKMLYEAKEKGRNQVRLFAQAS